MAMRGQRSQCGFTLATSLTACYGTRSRKGSYLAQLGHQFNGEASLQKQAPYRRLTSTDSDLEAFSRDPTGGSLAALAVRPAARTKYPNQWFLSY